MFCWSPKCWKIWFPKCLGNQSSGIRIIARTLQAEFLKWWILVTTMLKKLILGNQNSGIRIIAGTLQDCFWMILMVGGWFSRNLLFGWKCPRDDDISSPKCSRNSKNRTDEHFISGVRRITGALVSECPWWSANYFLARRSSDINLGRMSILVWQQVDTTFGTDHCLDMLVWKTPEALRLLPAETKLTVYRRRLVAIAHPLA